MTKRKKPTNKSKPMSKKSEKVLDASIEKNRELLEKLAEM